MDDEQESEIAAILAERNARRERTVVDEDTWDSEAWAGTIEYKMSRQAQINMALGAGIVVSLALMALQGRLVLKLVTGHKLVIEALNMSPGAEKATTVTRQVQQQQQQQQEARPNSNSRVQYGKPDKVITDKPQPNQEELNELMGLMDASRNGMDEPGGIN
jgi:hypothetical protein